MKPVNIILCIVISFIALFAAGNTASSQKMKYTYIGSQECKNCHASDAIGNQYRIWENSPHSKAYRNLRTEQGRKIGESAGIKNPPEDQACLKCHTTGGGKDMKTASEGVGCEACHGPASAYGEISNHAAYGDKDKDYARATTFGMYKILNIEGIKLREKMCRRCHTIERPCAPADPDDRKHSELALSVIADFVFKHPLK